MTVTPISARCAPIVRPIAGYRIASALARKLEAAILALVLLLATGAIIDVYLSGRGLDTYSPEGDPQAQLIWTAIYLAVGICSLKALRRTAATLSQDKLLIGLSMLALASSLWSALPDLTLRRSVALLGTTLTGAYIAAKYSVREQLRILAWVLAAAAILSTACVLLLPQIGIGDDGLWRGVFPHKNSLGRLMALAAVVFRVLAADAKKAKPLYWLGTAAALVILVLSGSGTGVLVVAILFASAGAVAWIQRSPNARAVPALALLTLSGVAISLMGAEAITSILGVLGKDDTLTGRTYVWAEAVGAIIRRPLLGYGYSAFWAGPGGQDIQAVLGPVFVHAHNGYLDLTLDVGLFGLALFTVTLVRNLWRSLMTYATRRDDMWPTLFFMFMAIYNVTESDFLQRNDLFWILYVSTTLAVASARRTQRRQSIEARQSVDHAGNGRKATLSQIARASSW